MSPESDRGASPHARPFQTGAWRVEPSRCVLERGRDGTEVRVEPRVMDLLVALASRRGEVVSKDELVRGVWQGRFVSDGAVSVAIFELRRALGDDARQPEYVETIPRRGYRWLPDVRVDTEPAAAGTPRATTALPRRWHRSVALAGLTVALAASILWLTAWPVPAPAPPRPEEATVAYRLGQHFLGQRLPSRIRRALEQFERAARLDPSFAEAHAGIAHASTMLADLEQDGARELYQQARASAERALALDGRLPEAHAALGTVRLFADWDFRRAEQSLQRAIALDDGTVSAHRAYSKLLSASGRHHEAVAAARRALALDPAAAVRYLDLTWALVYAGRLQEALPVIERGLEVDPGSFPLHVSKGLVLEQTGRSRAAFAAFCDGYLRQERGAEIVERLEAAYRSEGLEGVYRSWLDVTLRGSPNMPRSDVWLATLFSRLGQSKRALEALDRALEDREGALVWVGVEPSFRPLRTEPRFRRVVEQVGIPL